jgi:hypothetical protein
MNLVVHVHVYGVRLCLWTAATNGPIVHPSGDIYEYGAIVEWCRQRKTEELGEKPCHFVHRKSYMNWLAPTRTSSVRGLRLTAWAGTANEFNYLAV